VVLKESKNIKYFIVIIFLVFNSFSATNTNDAIYKDVPPIKTKKVDEPPFGKFPLSSTQNVSKKLDSVFKRLNKRHGFHGSVLVAQNGKLIFNNEYGYADFKTKTKLNSKSTFQLASVSKQFTATAVLILYEQGLIGLNDPVTEYFPNFPYKEITIKHLLNHTSGLPKYFWLAEHKWEKQLAPDNSEMIDLMVEYDLPLFFRPGSRFDYSNTGYFVLASLIEKVSGMEYGLFLDKNIFEPLNMKNSFVYRFQIDSEDENQLKGYKLYRRRRYAPVTGTVNDAIVGDKNVYSTAEDLLIWVNALNSCKVISDTSLYEMYTKGKTKYNRNVPYGYGFRIKNEDSEKIVYHNGKWNGFSTSIKQYTDSDLVIVILEHSNYKYMNYLSAKVKTIVDQNFENTVL